VNSANESPVPVASLEGISRHIKGFRGYSDASERQGEDARFRGFLTQRVNTAMERVKVLVAAAAEGKRLDLLSDFEEIRTGLVALLELLDMAPEALDDPAVPAGTISEWHQQDEEYLKGMLGLLERIDGLGAPVPERSDVLLLKDILDRLLPRFRDRSGRKAAYDEDGEREQR